MTEQYERRTVGIAGLAIAVAWSWMGCSFDETRFQHDCDVRADVAEGAVCRGGEWVVPTDAGRQATDTAVLGADAETVGRDCEDDEECGPGVCVDRTCQPCREGQTRRTARRCGYKDRGTIPKICEDNRWVDGSCADVWYRSCLEYLEANPEATNGDYELDPDGPGRGVSPETYFCIMNPRGDETPRGWTQVRFDTFEQGADGWTPDVGTSSCGDWGSIFGGYGKLGDETISKTFQLPPVPGQTVRLYLELIRIDSWDDGDEAIVRVDGREIWRKDLNYGSGARVCGLAFRDRKHRISRDFEASGDETRQYQIEVEGKTDEPADNESFGIDNVVFLIR